MPDNDWLFVNIYSELDQLRSTGLSHKDFIDIVNLKDKKKRAMCTESFMEGAMAALKQINQVKSFSELPDFKDFLF